MTATVTRIDQGLIDEVEELVRLGVPPLVAVMAQGATEEQFADWVERGRQGGRGNSQCMALVQAIARAEARCEAILIGKVRSAANQSWTAAAWLAERRFPERYVRKSVQGDREGEGGGTGDVRTPDPFAGVDDVENVTPIRRRG